MHQRAVATLLPRILTVAPEEDDDDNTAAKRLKTGPSSAGNVCEVDDMKMVNLMSTFNTEGTVLRFCGGRRVVERVYTLGRVCMDL